MDSEIRPSRSAPGDLVKEVLDLRYSFEWEFLSVRQDTAIVDKHFEKDSTFQEFLKNFRSD